MSDEEIDAKLEEDKKVDYDRIGERMCAEMLYVNYAGNGVDKYVSLVTKAAATGKVLVLGCEDADAAKAALEVCKAGKPILNGANASNYEEMQSRNSATRTLFLIPQKRPSKRPSLLPYR